MNIVVEKTKVVGTLSTLVGRFSLLELSPRKFISHVGNLSNSGALSFYVVDDEGFDNWIVFRGDFVIIPAQVPTMVDVKHVLTEQEAQEVQIHDKVNY